MARQPEGPPPPPTVQRLRVRYAKRGRLRFTSHRDFARAFERSLRRALVPMAYSAGFTPHPKISYLGAAPTGVASEAEYLEIGLAERRELVGLLAELDSSLPAGLDILEVVEAGPGSMADRLEASYWVLELPGVAPAEALRAVELLLAADTVPVERRTKNGMREIDVRAGIVSLRVDTSGDEASLCAILHLVVRHLTPAVRPDDVLSGLRRVADLAPPSPALATRRAQGPLDEHGTVADPLAPDRAGRPASDGVLPPAHERTADIVGAAPLGG